MFLKMIQLDKLLMPLSQLYKEMFLEKPSSILAQKSSLVWKLSLLQKFTTIWRKFLRDGMLFVMY